MEQTNSVEAIPVHLRDTGRHADIEVAAGQHNHNDLIHQNIILAKANAVLQREAMEARRQAFELQMRTKLLQQQVASITCTHALH